MRDENLLFLNEHGFKPATWMPLPTAVGEPSESLGFAGGELRPEIEIANRFLSLCAVFAWGSAPPEYERVITEFIERNDLRSSTPPEELGILDLPKEEASAQFSHLVGWRLVNMWSLAWILGLVGPPSAITGQLPEEVSGQLISLILPDFNVDADSLLAQGETVSIESVVALEDRFYLAHNAVRSGQTGVVEMLPPDFDPIADGGAIHERRHSLTWSLAPGASWDETDLST